MDSEYIQFVRYKLQKRLKRLNTATQQSFRPALIQTWAFLQSNEITKGILDDLESRRNGNPPTASATELTASRVQASPAR